MMKNQVILNLLYYQNTKIELIVKLVITIQKDSIDQLLENLGNL